MTTHKKVLTVLILTCIMYLGSIGINSKYTNITYRDKLIIYYITKGSKQPKEMSNAVLSTSNPRLLTAISVVETGGNPHIRKGGYKKKHSGAFQVNPKYWGDVPYDALGQAQQADRIIHSLQSKLTLDKALALYGGDSSKKKYSRKVYAQLQEVPRYEN